MAMSRKHFTILAELTGAVEAGRIPPDNFRNALQFHLLELEPTYKRDKFNRHADKQVEEVERVEAQYLSVGDSFLYEGNLYKASAVAVNTEQGYVLVTVKTGPAHVTLNEDNEIIFEFRLDELI